jgi:hypothetical protein
MMSENAISKTVNLDAKNLLSRLLASENIEVRHDAKAQTASFDVEARILILPMWENMGDRMYDMFIGHEVSHALFTPAGETNLLDALRAVSGVSREGKAWHAAKMLLNVVEDARIERLIQRKFPGLVRDFREGYAEIIERDFFGLGDEHPNERGFVDRLNIHFKAGAHFTIEFDSAEQPFVERIEDAETWDEVVEICRDLYEFLMDRDETAPEEQPQEAGEGESGEGDEGEGDTGMPSGEEDGPMGNPVGAGGLGTEEETEGDDESTSGAGTGDSDEESEESGSAAGGEDSGDSMEDDTDDGESAEGETKNAPASGSDAGENGSEAEGEVPDTGSTQQSMDRSSQGLVNTEAPDIIYGTAPKANLKNMIHDYSKVIEDFASAGIADQWTIQHVNAAYSKWEGKSKRVAGAMAKRFDLKKAADVAKRTMVAKTGVIDPVRMVNYKWSEDIFRKNNILPEGKSHAVTVFLDWSGSMDDIVSDTLEQAMLLASFCKRAGIPFELFAFSNGGHCPENIWDYRDGDFRCGDFRLLNLLSTRARGKDWERLIKCCLCLVEKKRSRGYNSREWTGLQPHGYGLGGTPLDDTVIAAKTVLDAIKRQTGVQVMNCFFMTDGGTSSSPLSGAGVVGSDQNIDRWNTRSILKGRGNKQWMSDGDYWRGNSTEILMKWLGAETGAKVMGMFLTGYSGACQTDKQHAEFAEKKCVEVGAYQGYENYWLLNPEKGKGKTTEDLDGTETMTVRRNAMIRTAQLEKTVRNMMERVAECVALDSLT